MMHPLPNISESQRVGAETWLGFGLAPVLQGLIVCLSLPKHRVPQPAVA
jgi:hypothetical protein